MTTGPGGEPPRVSRRAGRDPGPEDGLARAGGARSSAPGLLAYQVSLPWQDAVQVPVEAFQVRMPVPEDLMKMVFVPFTCAAGSTPVPVLLPPATVAVKPSPWQTEQATRWFDRVWFRVSVLRVAAWHDVHVMSVVLTQLGLAVVAPPVNRPWQ